MRISKSFLEEVAPQVRPRELMKRQQDLKERNRFPAKAIIWAKGQPEAKESPAYVKNQK